MAQQDEQQNDQKDGPTRWATWKPFQIFFKFLTQTEKIQVSRTLWTNCWTIEGRKETLFTKDDPKSDDNILNIDPLDKKVCKKASLIDVGTKAKVLFSGNLVEDEHEEKFRKGCHMVTR